MLKCCLKDPNIFALRGATVQYVKRLKNEVLFLHVFHSISSNSRVVVFFYLESACACTSRKVLSHICTVFTDATVSEKDNNRFTFGFSTRRQVQPKSVMLVLAYLSFIFPFCFFGNLKNTNASLDVEGKFMRMKTNGKMPVGYRISDQSL